MRYKIYSGAGNDFVMFDNRESTVPFEAQAEFTRMICSEKFRNIDGVIFLEKPVMDGASIRMNYYNRDGSYGAMCGNGARCIAQFARDIGLTGEGSFKLEVLGKLYDAQLIGDGVIKIGFPDVKVENANRARFITADIGKGEQGFHCFRINVGAEHLVLCIADPVNYGLFGINRLDEAKVNEWGQIFRFHKAFYPYGANVNFMDIMSPEEIRIRTYERGVERETLACGTGIIASAITANLLYAVRPPVKVLTQSGEKLAVDFQVSKGQVTCLRRVSLQGSAKKISEGVLTKLDI